MARTKIYKAFSVFANWKNTNINRPAMPFQTYTKSAV